MADEKLSLLFRRGTIDQILAGDKIVPGAVSFCTDEPGIYLDLTAAEGGGTAKRVRVGDFITVASFDDIKAQATAAQDPDKAFSEHCLYYSIKENALMKYNKAEKTFIVINDLAEVKASIKANEEAIIANDGDILKLQQDLAKEVDNREDAITGLSNRIDALAGGDGEGDSLIKIRADLDAEIEARGAADTAFESQLTGVSAKATANESAIATLNALVGSLPSDVTGTIVQYIDSKVLAEENRAKGVENGLRADVDGHTTQIGANTTAITGEQARAEAAEAALDSKVGQAQQKADDAYTAAQNEALKAREEEGKLDAKITELSGKHNTFETGVNNQLSTISGNLATATNTANSALQKANTNAGAIAQEVSDREAAVTGVSNALNEYKNFVSEEFEKVEDNIGKANAAVDVVAGNLEKETNRATQKETELANAIADTNTAINNEKTAREQADTALDLRIDGVAESISSESGKVSVLRDEMDQAKEDIKDLQEWATAADKAIDDESVARAQADNALQNAIDTEAAARAKTDGELSAAISAEAVARAKAITDALKTASDDAAAKDAEILAEINSQMAAANSMTFMGSVSSYNDIPASGNKAGDTYLVQNAFGGADTDPQIGDLLVIEHDQDANSTFADAAAKKAAVIWVKTGYSTFNDPKMMVEDAKIKFKSHLNEVLGTVSVNSTSENIVASISGTDKDATINVSFVWGTF